MGYSGDVTALRIAELVENLFHNPILMKCMSKNALGLMGIQKKINNPSIVKLLLEDRSC